MKITGGLDWQKDFEDLPTITWNGIPIDHVCEADDEQGYVVFEVTDTDGLVKLGYRENEVGIETRRIEGVVTILGKRI